MNGEMVDDSNVENFATILRRIYQCQCESERELRLYRRNEEAGSAVGLRSKRRFGS